MRVFSRDLSSINTFNTSATVEILVSDTNDNPPVFNNDHYTLELPESLPPGTMFPAFFKVSDLDEGDNGKIVRFQLQYLDNVNDTKSTLDELVNGESPLQNSDIFHINNATGSITLTGTLDFETKNKHELLLIAFDGGNPANIGQAKVSIQVRNVNEFPPRFLALPYLFYVQERAKVGTEVGRIIAVDDDFNKITFSISSAANNNHKSNGQPDDVEYFQIDESSGKITVREQLPERTEFVFVAKATDDGLPQNYSLGVQVVVKVQVSVGMDSNPLRILNRFFFFSLLTFFPLSSNLFYSPLTFFLSFLPTQGPKRLSSRLHIGELRSRSVGETGDR